MNRNLVPSYAFLKSLFRSGIFPVRYDLRNSRRTRPGYFRSRESNKSYRCRPGGNKRYCFSGKMVSVHQALIGILFPVKSAGSKCSGRIGLENRIVEDRSKFVVIAAYRVEKILIVVENMELHAIKRKFDRFEKLSLEIIKLYATHKLIVYGYLITVKFHKRRFYVFARPSSVTPDRAYELSRFGEHLYRFGGVSVP